MFYLLMVRIISLVVIVAMPFDIIMFRLKYRTVLSTVTIRLSLNQRRGYLLTIVFVSNIMRQVKWQTGGLIQIKAQQTKMVGCKITFE